MRISTSVKSQDGSRRHHFYRVFMHAIKIQDAQSYAESDTDAASVRPSVCLSIRPWSVRNKYAGIVLKRLN